MREHQLGSISLRDRVVKVDTFPMGIDFERLARANELALVSGRSRADLEEWFGRLPIAPDRGAWHVAQEARRRLADAEKHAGRVEGTGAPVDRLPGALLEEKEFSLAWHYRMADPEQASQRAQKLIDDLSGYTRNIDVQVLEGNKVIEIRNTGVNKGTAALEWLGPNPPEFVLGIGDDWTDEDRFRALPASAFSVRVGVAKTAAQYYLSSHATVRRLLRELGSARLESGAAAGEAGAKPQLTGTGPSLPQVAETA